MLVFHDLLGITTGHMAKFVKRYADVHEQMVDAVERYGDEVRSRHFPEPDHVYSVEPAELDEFRRYLDQESLTSAEGLGLGAAGSPRIRRADADLRVRVEDVWCFEEAGAEAE